jgi:hypothetical protein
VLFAFGSAILVGVLILASIVVLIAVFIAFFIAVFDGSFDCWEGEREEREMEDTDCQSSDAARRWRSNLSLSHSPNVCVLPLVKRVAASLVFPTPKC